MKATRREGHQARIALHKIQGYVVILHHVRCVYPVANCKAGWEWGFKFSDGFYENFVYKDKSEAHRACAEFVKALSDYWRKQEINLS